MMRFFFNQKKFSDIAITLKKQTINTKYMT